MQAVCSASSRCFGLLVLGWSCSLSSGPMLLLSHMLWWSFENTGCLTWRKSNMQKLRWCGAVVSGGWGGGRCDMLLLSQSFGWSFSGCLLLHFAQIDHAKTSSFCSFQDNNLKIAAQFPLKKTTKAWYLRHFRKNAA